MPDADDGSSARWAKAAARAEGVTDLGIGGAVRGYYLIHFPITVLAGLGLGFVFAALWPPEPGDILLAGFVLGLMLAGLASGILGLI